MRCTGVQGSNACVGRVTTDGHPGLERSTDYSAFDASPLRGRPFGRSSPLRGVVRSSMYALGLSEAGIAQRNGPKAE